MSDIMTTPSFFPSSELPLHDNGAVYHIAVRPENIADHIILVGDPERVPHISAHFDRVDFKQQHREIVTHTGVYKGQAITVLSTGMGTDNIDIILNELDALANIDLEHRLPKAEHRKLHLLRIGTCGSLRADVPVGRFLMSSYAFGMDGLMHFYAPSQEVFEADMMRTFEQQIAWPSAWPKPYFVKASEELLERMRCEDIQEGITVSVQGFYGPQGRRVRLPLAFDSMHQVLGSYDYHGWGFANMEMETSALFGLAKALGHEALTICLVVANRVTHEFVSDALARINERMDRILDDFLKVR